VSKPAGRLGKSYRIMWDQNSGLEGFYNPPMDATRVAQAHLGHFEGTPVDAYVCALGCNAGYNVGWPTKVEGMEFFVDRLTSGKCVGSSQWWRAAENLRRLWESGVDPGAAASSTATSGARAAATGSTCRRTGRATRAGPCSTPATSATRLPART
jgi:hypothetical protein